MVTQLSRSKMATSSKWGWAIQYGLAGVRPTKITILAGRCLVSSKADWPITVEELRALFASNGGQITNGRALKHFGI